MDDQRDGNYLWEKIGHSQEIVIKYKKLINNVKNAMFFITINNTRVNQYKVSRKKSKYQVELTIF